MLKKMKILGLMGLISISLVGCNEVEDFLTISDEIRNDGWEIIKEGEIFTEFRNKETGVHYYRYTNGYVGGLSVVYNSDGTVKITEVNENGNN